MSFHADKTRISSGTHLPWNVMYCVSTNKYVARHIFSNRLQMLPKYGKKQTHGAANCITDVLTTLLCDLSDTWQHRIYLFYTIKKQNVSNGNIIYVHQSSNCAKVKAIPDTYNSAYYILDNNDNLKISIVWLSQLIVAKPKSIIRNPRENNLLVLLQIQSPFQFSKDRFMFSS